MTGISIGTVIGVIILLIALVVVFFPFVFRIEFRADMTGARASVYLFKKKLFEGEKKFKEESSAGAADGNAAGSAAGNVAGSKETAADDDDEEFAPTYVPPVKTTAAKTESDFGDFEIPDDGKLPREPLKVVSIEDSASAAEETAPVETAAEPAQSIEIAAPVEPVTSTEPATEVVEATSSAPSRNVEKLAALKAAEEEPLKPADEPSTDEPAVAPGDDTSATETAAPPKPEKRKKLTETEFWTIILTPEFDASAFWAVRKLLSALLNLFRVKFIDCFAEGIRADYVTMGYGAALNGILKSFPFVGAWDIRMDWTHDHELCAQGQIRASINLCRIIGLILTTLVLGGLIAFKFWRRRAHVLKTNELPELGWIRSKIVKLLAED